MRRVNHIKLNISVDERLPLRKEPAISEWYRAGIEERRPLLLEADEQTPPSKASSFGFGLKKSGFGLNAKKNDQPDKDQENEHSDNESVPFDQLKLEGTQENLNATLSSWAGWQHYLQLKFGAPAVFLGIGSVSMGNRTFGPLLLIPVTLMTNREPLHFELQFEEGSRVYVPSVKRIIDRKNVALPTLPDISDDFSPNAWIEDMKSALVPHDDLSFISKSWLVRCTYQREYQKEDQRQERESSEVLINDHSLSDLPPEESTVDPLSQAHRRYLDEIDSDMISWVISRDQIARKDLLRDLMLSSLAHDQQILILGRYNDQLSLLYEQGSEVQLAPLMFPAFSGYSSQTLLDSIADIVDADWNVRRGFIPNGSSISSTAQKEAGESIHTYQQALCKPHGALGYSPAQLIERLLRYQEVPTLPVSINKIKEVTQADVDRWTQIGIEYAKVSSGEVDPDNYEWSDTQLTSCSDDDLIETNESLEKLIRIKNELFNGLLEAQDQTGLPIPSSPDEIEYWIEQTEFYDSAPKLDEKQLRPDTLQHLSKGDKILSLLEKVQKYHQSVTSYFHKQILEEHLEGVVSRLRKQSLSSMRFLNYRYRKDMSRLKQYRRDQDSDNDVLFWEKLKDAKILKQIRKKLRSYNHEASRLFDESWNGYQSDVNDLSRQLRWLKKFYDYTGGKDAANTLEIRNYVASLKRMTNDQKDSIRELNETFHDQIEACIDVAELSDQSSFRDVNEKSWHQIDKILKSRKQSLKELPDWLSYKKILKELDRPDLSDLLDKIDEHETLRLSQWEQVLQKTVLQSLLEDAKNERNVLQDVPQAVISGSLEQLVKYRQSERNKQISGLIEEHLNRRQELVSDQEIQAGLNVLQHELKKQRRLQPKGRLLNQTHGTLKTFAPIWMLRYDQIDEYRTWLNDFQLIIVIDPNQNELDVVASLDRENSSIAVLHTDGPSDFELTPFASEQEKLPEEEPDNEFEVQENDSDSRSDSGSAPLSNDEKLIEDLLADIDRQALSADVSSDYSEHFQTNVNSLELPQKRNLLPGYLWPRINQQIKNDLVSFSISILEGKHEAFESKSSDQNSMILWCSSNKHQKLWEEICSNEFLSKELLSHRGIHTTPQILSSALQTPESLEGVFAQSCFINVPYVDTGSAAAPSFGFKKTKQKTQKAAIDQLPGIDNIWEVTSNQVNLISTNQDNIDEYKKQWSTDYYPQVNAKNHLLASAVQDHLGDDWEITGHPKKPFELKIRSKQYDSLTFYIWSDLLQQTDFNYLLDYYEVLDRSEIQLIYFPAVYFPARLHEWLISLQQRLQRAFEEKQAEELAKQEEAKKQEQITREVQEESEDSKEQKTPVAKQSETDIATDSKSSGPYDLPNGLKDYELPEDPPFESVKEQKQAQLPEARKITPSEEYRLHEGQTLGTKMDFFDASDNEMQKLILDIVDVEAPIHWRNLLRCVASYWQIQRINQNVERVVLRNIQQLSDKDRLFLKDGCIYNDDDFTFKLRDRSSTIEYHRADELPLDECETVLYELLKQRSPIQEQALLRSGATVLGFQKFDRMLEHQFRKALYRMGEQDVVVKGPNGFELAPSYKMNAKS